MAFGLLVSPYEREISHWVMNEYLPQLVKGFDANLKDLHFSAEAHGSDTHKACQELRTTQQDYGETSLPPTLPTETYIDLKPNKIFLIQAKGL
ncbi:MAG: hypothetical protein A7315_03850 [Candidatus Altiarchaeales archaeon WOR_SM1_79]|nr:MAG: hypothetical protein A7315_03850 [Candidatus Altiarchaeales archaeon WOR_SM1_79]